MKNQTLSIILGMAMIACPIGSLFGQTTQEILTNGNFNTPNAGWGYNQNADQYFDQGSDIRSHSAPGYGEINSLLYGVLDYGLITQGLSFPPNTQKAVLKFHYLSKYSGSGLSDANWSCYIRDGDRFSSTDKIFWYWSAGYGSTLGQYNLITDTITPKQIAYIQKMHLPWLKFQGANFNGWVNVVLRLDDVSIMAIIGPPIADFKASETIIRRLETIEFYDSSSATPTSWLWKFYDGSPGLGYQTSTDSIPTVKYDYLGTFDVSLTVTNALGSDTKLKKNYIKVNPAFGVPNTDHSITYRVHTFPNPVTDLLTVEFLDALSNQNLKLSIYNSFGQKLCNINTDGKRKVDIPFEQYPNGVYLLYIENAEGLVVGHRVVK